MMAAMNNLDIITPDWPAPASVKAFTTTRSGGVSQGPYHSFNLAQHVGDNPAHVQHNRATLQHELALPQAPLWLQQTHSPNLIDAQHWYPDVCADGCFSRQVQQVCVVMTADCLPILIYDPATEQIGAIHAGWRGLANGIIAELAKHFSRHSYLWLGPAIGPQHFEVQDDMMRQFPDDRPAFTPGNTNHFLADIYQLAFRQLERAGFCEIYGGHYCTYAQAETFFSYRRDGVTGRMANLIWKST